jgi:hypothetical protein
MDNCSWNRVSPEKLQMIDYCNGIESFINYALFNLKNISGDVIRYPCNW